MAVLAFLFSLHGSAGPRAAFMVWLLTLIGSIGAAILAELSPMQHRFVFPVLAFLAVVHLAVSARRLHDAGHSGRWALLTLVPFIGFLAGLAFVFLPPRRSRVWDNAGWHMVGYLGMVGLLCLGLLRLSWTPYFIPSEAMKPTLLVGDYAVAKTATGAQVQRGDVIVFRGVDQDVAQIKRVVALAGDRVALRSGQIWLNGAPVLQLGQGDFTEVMAPQGPRGLRPRCANGLVGDGAICRKKLLREVFSGAHSHFILDIETGSVGDEFAEVTVPAGMLFVLGDNRDNSVDSRFAVGAGGLGFVPQTAVYGVMRFVLVSAQGSSPLAFWTWRGDRFFTKVDG